MISSTTFAMGLTINGVFTWLSAILLMFNYKTLTDMATGMLMVSLFSLIFLFAEIANREKK